MQVQALPGQLWWLHREGVNQLALIASRHARRLTFWPAVLDGELADENALIIPEAASGMLTDCAVWPSAETVISFNVLDRKLITVLECQCFLQLRQAWRSGAELEWQRGTQENNWMTIDVIQRAAFFRAPTVNA